MLEQAPDLTSILGEAPNMENLRTLARVRRDYAERIVETLIDAMDALDESNGHEEQAEDNDLLDYGELDEADHEPTLGWPERVNQTCCDRGSGFAQEEEEKEHRRRRTYRRRARLRLLIGGRP